MPVKHVQAFLALTVTGEEFKKVFHWGPSGNAVNKSLGISAELVLM